MGARYDQQYVTIDNQSGFKLSLSYVGSLEHGQWNQTPVAGINNAITTLAFSTFSAKDAHVGPGPGEVHYDLPDGCRLSITFDCADTGQSKCAAALSGATASKYTISMTDCRKTKTYSGTGKNIYTTIKIENTPGDTGATCLA